MPVPTHVHSEYSNLDGLSTLEEIAQRCVQIGCPCCGLSDHGTVAGHIQQAKVFKKYDIKPIFACEVYHGVKPVGFTQWKGNQRDQHHLIVGALNNTGLRNLWALLDESADNFRHVSRATTEMLRKHAEGTYATSACALGLVSKGIVNGDYTWANEYLDIWGDDFYVALSTYPADKPFNDQGEEPLNQGIINEALYQFAQERGLRVIYEDDAHYAAPEDYEYHDLYLAMQTKQDRFTPVDERRMWHPEALFIHDEQQIRDALHYLPDAAVDEAIANSVELGERVTAELPEVKRHLPQFVVKDCPWVKDEQREMTTVELFLDLIEKGAYERYGDNPDQEVWDRIAREVAVYLDDSSGIRLYDYMLMGWDLIAGFCRSEEIEVGPGRGSSAGSIVAYCLGITDVDPLYYGLIFERFWNAGRADGFPDIDMDFPRKSRRTQVIPYLERRWGKQRVRSIGTVGRMKPKAVANKTWKVCGVNGVELVELKNILDGVPDLEIHGVNQIGWTRETEPGKVIYVMEHVGAEIIEWIERQPEDRQEILAYWLDVMIKLSSRISHQGTHPSGVIVSDVDLPYEMPCRWTKDSTTGEYFRVTMFNMDEVDSRWFVKLDILGLRTLDTLTEWKRIMKGKGVDINWSGLERQEFDEDMWKLVDRKKVLGIFQIEEGNAIKRLAAEYKPRSVQDCSILVALNRPGPLRPAAGEDESTAERFVKRKAGLQEVSYQHEFLKPTLEETYGLFLYQEQVIDFFNRMNYTLGDSDAVRKILGKKKPEVMARLKTGQAEWDGKGYMQVAADYVDNAAESIWNTMEGFASYSFNKSHSVAYGTIMVRTLFAKYYAPLEWYLAAVRTDEERAGKHIAEARAEQTHVLPPDILQSEAQVSEDADGNLRYGFNDIKGVGSDSAEFIVKLRATYGEDMRTRTGLEAALATEKKLWKERQTEAKKNLQPFHEKSPGQMLQSNKIDALEAVGAFDSYESRNVSLREMQELEREYLGTVLTDDSYEVLDAHREDFDDLDTFEDLLAPYEGDMQFRVPGIVSKVEEKKTKAGDAMASVTIEFDGDECEFAVFPRQWKSHKWLFGERTPGIFTLRHSLNKKSGRTGYNFQQGQKLS
jgi:DNA polymerase-3 subunit alpha